MHVPFFPIEHYWWLYLCFTAFILSILVLDLGVFHRKARAVTFKEAAGWSIIWICLALLVNTLFYFFARWRFHVDPRLLAIPNFNPDAAAAKVALEFFTGFVVEKSLAIDNIFVFVVIFSYFGIPAKYQHRILFYGIIGALIFRAIFIALGAWLIQYDPIVIIFGVFLVFTGIKIFFAPEKELDPGKNPIIKLLSKRLPLSQTLDDQRFITYQDGKALATPLLFTLILVEVSDIIFAVDSVPAIFAITREPMIVFFSNVLAILGLRSLYFLLASVVDKFHLLKYGLGLVLIFVGGKMIFFSDETNGHFPIGMSLAIILTIILSSIILSLLRPARRDVD